MTKTARLILFLLLFVALEVGLMVFIDKPLSLYLRTVDIKHHDLIDFFRGYTDLGLGKWYEWPSALGVFVCALLIRLPKLRKRTRLEAQKIGEALLFLFISVAASGLIADTIKFFVGRARPVLLERENFYGFHPMMQGSVWRSWPSGHTTTAFALACVLLVLFPRGIILWFILALAIALSRVMVNAHYLSDVIAGATLGIVTVLMYQHPFARNGINHIKQCFFPIDKRR